MRKKWFLWMAIAVVLVLGGIALIRIFPLSKEEKSNLKESVVIAKRGNITRIVSATGYLSPLKYGSLRFNRSGRLKQIMVDEGNYVKEGQILARLEDDQEKLSLLRAENALKEAESELKKAKVSSPKNVIEESQRQVKERELELQLRKKDLEDTLLKAPFPGVVSKIYAEEKEVVSTQTISASKDILRLIDTGTLFADVCVDEVDISQIQIGNKARITIDAYPDEVFLGKVVEIAPETTTSSGLIVIEVKIELEKADPKLKPGFTASADIIVGEAKNVLILPVETVNEEGKEKFVAILEEGKPSLKHIAVGVSDGTNVEIKSGLKEGELVLSSGLQKLIEIRRKQKEAKENPQRGGGSPFLPSRRH
ncbi:efflux RND transporter periplasmic adaptor subunit [Patescibacteria group bacterium]|nr:efflux RND transporter periplasmic adaptor subunit [Patescibacteria group bacterium]